MSLNSIRRLKRNVQEIIDSLHVDLARAKSDEEAEAIEADIREADFDLIKAEKLEDNYIDCLEEGVDPW